MSTMERIVEKKTATIHFFPLDDELKTGRGTLGKVT